MNFSFGDSAPLFFLSGWVSPLIPPHPLTSVWRSSSSHASPASSALPPALSTCAQVCRNTHTHTWIYFGWHLALDRCSLCSLYLQPLKWVFFILGIYDSWQKYVWSHLWLWVFEYQSEDLSSAFEDFSWLFWLCVKQLVWQTTDKPVNTFVLCSLSTGGVCGWKWSLPLQR